MNEWMNEWLPEWMNTAVITMFNTLRCSQQFEIYKEDDLNTNKLVEIQCGSQWRCSRFLFVEQRISTKNIYMTKIFSSAIYYPGFKENMYFLLCNSCKTLHIPAFFNIWHTWATNQNRHIVKRLIYSYSI